MKIDIYNKFVIIMECYGKTLIEKEIKILGERRKKKENIIALENTKNEAFSLLKKYGEYQRFHESDIYIMQPDSLSFFTAIDDSLKEYKKNTVKGKAYCIDKIVNLINPDNPAFQYNFTIAEKYVYISTKETCIKEALKRVEISANIIRNNLRKHIEENPSYSEDFIIKLEEEAEDKIQEERRKVKEIDDNPEILESIRISGFKNKIEYGQVNFGYYKIVDGKKTKIRTNKHLSVVYPNVIFYEPDEEADKHKQLMEAKYLEKNGFEEITRNVYVKYKKG